MNVKDEADDNLLMRLLFILFPFVFAATLERCDPISFLGYRLVQKALRRDLPAVEALHDPPEPVCGVRVWNENSVVSTKVANILQRRESHK